jgi:tetratricopeptide (TPR) repeat protein
MTILQGLVLRRWAGRALLIAILLIAAPAAYSEIGADAPKDSGTLFGNYLSGRMASRDRDIATAADFYSRALAEDPKNEIILEQAFLLEAASADWDDAVRLAKDLVKNDSTNRIARFLLGIEAFKQGRYDEADEHFAEARQGPIADLTSTLARAWVKQAAGKPQEAFATLDELSNADWAQFYQRYHRALIADVAGRGDIARGAYAQAFKKNPSTLRVADAYARHAVNAKNRKLARQTLQSHIAKSAEHPISEALLAEIEAGKTPPLLVANPTQGLAEVFYGIGDALAGEGGIEMGIVFLQFALYLKPDFPLAHTALAEAYDSAKRYELEIDALDQIEPNSPIWLNAQIQKAFALNALERVEDASALLEELIVEAPKDVRPLDALGNILRSHERFGEAREYYSRALGLVPAPVKDNWTLYYSRGVCSERLKEWPAAEADFKKALALAPDESLVLNYLGYSWVDQGQNLKRAMNYIRKAVRLKPDDGYYVDSLGWAYYRLGKFTSAVEHLERAVELKPDDPIINDHLGDAYWKVGRTLEAKYQWEQALTLEPDDELVETLKKKIVTGLPETSETKSAQDRTKQAGQKAE